MNLVAIACGIIAGGILFTAYAKLAGWIVGGLIAFLVTRLISIQDKLAVLERQLPAQDFVLREEQSPNAEKPVATPRPEKQPPEKMAALEVERLPELAPVTLTTSSAAPAKPQPIKTPPPDTNQIDLWQIVASYFTGGNVVVRVGVIVLFFGVAFLLKYTAERNLIPIEFRLLGVCLGAMGLLAFGWRLRQSRMAYALILQGGGIGLLYLTIFAALRLYNLLPPWLALLLLVGMSLFSATLAVLQDARVLAVVGISGGFLAPVLASTGGGNHVMLFSYYTLLNASILYTAWYKSWRELNLVGFVFTFVIGTVWGGASYDPGLFATTEPFLILFFLFYVAIAVLFAKNQPFALKGYVDSSLVFGTPIICFALQTALVKPHEYGLAWSALGMGSLYVTLAWAIFRNGSASMRTLVEAFLALGLVFGTIAIPLALDGRWTAAAWALEGAAIVWVGLRQNRWLARVFGLLLQPLAGVAFLLDLHTSAESIPVLNGFFLGCLAISLAGLLSSYFLFLYKEKIPSAETESSLALIWGLLWWFGAGRHEIDFFVAHDYGLSATLVFFAGSAPLFLLAGTRLRWDKLRKVCKGLLLILLLAGLSSFVRLSHPAQYGGFIAWPLALFSQYFLLYRQSEKDEKTLSELGKALHVGTFLLLVALLTWEAHWWIDHWVAGSGTWPLVTTALIPALLVFLFSKYWSAISWPVSCFPTTYLSYALTPVVVFLWLWSLFANRTSPGDPWPLAYLPFLNPLDITQAFLLLAAAAWAQTLREQLKIPPLSLNTSQLSGLAAGTFFFWLNAVLIRTLHHWGEVPFHFTAMMSSDLVQTALSIFWTLSAFLVMFVAKNRNERNIWMVGAALIGVAIAKLFTIDLASTGTVGRIISFLGVGLICLVIGYLAPLPPRTPEQAESS